VERERSEDLGYSKQVCATVLCSAGGEVLGTGEPESPGDSLHETGIYRTDNDPDPQHVPFPLRNRECMIEKFRRDEHKAAQVADSLPCAGLRVLI
jgi:hypothetical protein